MLNEINPKKLTNGILLFENVISMEEHQYVIPFIESLKQKAVQEDYTIIRDSDGNQLYAINRSGHRYAVEDIEKSSSHIMNFLDNNTDPKIESFFTNCELAFRKCLLEYIEKYPMVLPNLWWRIQGHILAYGPSSGMGLHNDNDVNYQPGFEPDLQIATRSVVSSIMYFNSSVESAYDIKQNEYVGGEIEFPYLGVKYSPKAGDLLIFPSNYLATHEVKQCFHGSRYAYVGYYSQGSRQIDRGITVQDQTLSVGKQGQVWMPEIIEQYKNHIFNKHKNSNKETLDRLLQPTARMFNSANTQEELS
jgi:hypothetical protein